MSWKNETSDIVLIEIMTYQRLDTLMTQYHRQQHKHSHNSSLHPSWKLSSLVLSQFLFILFGKVMSVSIEQTHELEQTWNKPMSWNKPVGANNQCHVSLSTSPVSTQRVGHLSNQSELFCRLQHSGGFCAPNFKK